MHLSSMILHMAQIIYLDPPQIEEFKMTNIYPTMFIFTNKVPIPKDIYP